jgi:hypothetical protein
MLSRVGNGDDANCKQRKGPPRRQSKVLMTWLVIMLTVTVNCRARVTVKLDATKHVDEDRRICLLTVTTCTQGVVEVVVKKILTVNSKRSRLAIVVPSQSNLTVKVDLTVNFTILQLNLTINLTPFIHRPSNVSSRRP